MENTNIKDKLSIPRGNEIIEHGMHYSKKEVGNGETKCTRWYKTKEIASAAPYSYIFRNNKWEDIIEGQD